MADTHVGRHRKPDPEPDEPDASPAPSSTAAGVSPEVSRPLPSERSALMIETKVTIATLVSLLASILLAVLSTLAGENSPLDALDPIWQGLILAVIPPLSAFLGGFVAPHTPRAPEEL